MNKIITQVKVELWNELLSCQITAQGFWKLFASYSEDFRFQYLYQINVYCVAQLSVFNFKKSENDLVGSISRIVWYIRSIKIFFLKSEFNQKIIFNSW